ncbi:MAG: DsrE family protein [Thermoleophilia bacterium]|nr:DsrE family protein [Thermoleophilia bacterium]
MSALDMRGRSITTFVVYEIASRVDRCEVGQAVDVVVDDTEALDRDLRAWSAATGNEVRGGAPTAGGREYSIVKGVPRETDLALAMVISNPGLFELLSPLGFALAASLEGISVRIYFQAQAVRVLKSGFTPRIQGVARPFSRFARRGLERAGHVHPQDKLRQLEQRGADFYLCGPSMEHFKVSKEDLIFPDAKIAAYLTFMSVMAESDIHVFVQ